MAGVVAHLRAAIANHGISARELAERLGISPDGVYQQLSRPHPRPSTVERYAAALTAVLAERGDPRVFTASSLHLGAQPQPAEVAADAGRRLQQLQLGLAEQYGERATGPPAWHGLQEVLALVAATLASQAPEVEVRAAPLVDTAVVGPRSVVDARGLETAAVPYLGTLPAVGRLGLRGAGRSWLKLERRLLGPSFEPDGRVVVAVGDDSLAGWRLRRDDLLVVALGAEVPQAGALAIVYDGENTLCRRIVRLGDILGLASGPDLACLTIVPDEAKIEVMGVVEWVQPSGFRPA